MDISKSVALLKACLDYVPHIKSLAHDPKNQEFVQWDGEVQRIIIDTFGRDSKEYTRYNSIHILTRVNTQEEKEQAYIDYVSRREAALRDIIKEHEMPTEVHTQSGGTSRTELELFYNGFVRYRELVLKKRREGLTGVEESEFQTLTNQLQRRYGSLKEVIEKYGGPSLVPLQGGKREYEAFSSAFNYTIFGSGALDAVLDKAITTINIAIGKSEEAPESDQLVEYVEREARIMKVNPLFQRRDFLLEEDLCFVLMPFAEPFTRLYLEHIKPTLEALNLRVIRSDDLFTPTPIIEDIWEYINKACFVVADVTGRNPNVFYELGIAHTVGKDAIILTQSKDDIPFDVGHIRYFEYTDNLEGRKKLQLKLKRAAEAILNIKHEKK